MLALRRPQHEARVEIMPMIDVIFLLLTFFIYAMVLMVRAELMPLNAPKLRSAEPTTAAPMISISLDLDSRIFVDKEEVTFEELTKRVPAEAALDPDTMVYFLYDAGQGSKDRLSLAGRILDALRVAGVDVGWVSNMEAPPESGPTAEP